MDDGEPQTVRYKGHFITTWVRSEGEWVVRVESIDLYAKPYIRKEINLDHGDRLNAYERAKSVIDRLVGKDSPNSV